MPNQKNVIQDKRDVIDDISAFLWVCVLYGIPIGGFILGIIIIACYLLGILPS